MTEPIEDTLRDVLVALRAWWEWQRGENFACHKEPYTTLYAACAPLFALADRDPREQAVLNAAKAWSRNYWRRDYVSDYGPEAKLAAAVDALLLHEEPDTTGPKCDMKGCNERGAGVARCVFPNGNHYYACRAHRNAP